jgi:signal transduction histidine kinase
VQRRSTRRILTSKRASAGRADRSIREIEQFESLISELSAAMARVPADAVDSEIDAWLGKICLALDLDRSAVYQRTTVDGPVYISHTWTRPNSNIPSISRSVDVGRYFKKTTEWVLAGNPFVYAHRSEIPADFLVPDRVSERYSPKALAAMPMWAGERVIGAASFGRFRSPREWSPRLLERLTLAVRIFGSAVERKRAAAESQASRAELALAQRRSMMGEMVASLAHELNQPLGAILNNLGGLGRLLAQGNREPALAARAISNAIEDTKRAGEIVRRVRAMFSGAGTNKVAVDLAALVNEVVTLIGSESALRKITLEIESAASPLEVLGDRVLLQQCVLNLVVNAFDALMDTAEHERRVTVAIAPEKPGWIALSVGDNGTGIDPSVAGRVFEPFVTTKSGGMGLGLLVTQSIVEDHGGKIWLMPNAERGTTFTFTLPLVEKTGARRKPARKNTGERKVRAK